MAQLPPPVAPPLDGSIAVLPGFVDFHVKHNPDHEWARLAHEDDDQYTPVTFRQYADSTHRIARTFRPDGTRTNGELVAVLIHCDVILYLALIPGLVRAGFIPFPMSPKNSAPAIVSMLEKTSCHRIISQNMFEPLISAVQADLAKKQFALQYDELPSLDRIFPQFGGDVNAPVEPFPLPEKPHDKYDIVLYLHSSGSTGFPKPIPQRQCAILQWCSSSVVKSAADRGVIWGSHGLPTFHTMAIHMQLYVPLVGGYPVGLYMPKAPAAPPVPTPANLIAACKASKVNGIPIVPAVLEAWAQSDEIIEYLSTLDIVMFAGGPLSEKNGNKLAAAGVTLFSVYGGTEYGVYTCVYDADDSQGPDAPVKTSADWAWMTFPKDKICRWDPQGDGTYELQYLTCATHDPAVENLPDTRGYATSDLFIPHPTKKGLWKVAGRKDDVLVMGTGEKVVPLQQEGIITSNRMVSGAIMFGRGKNQCGLLVEPRPEHAVDPNDPNALVEFRNKIWPAVEEANKVAPSFARIFKEMIIATDPLRPLPRAAKGTIVRPQAMNLYAEDIERLYQVVNESADTKGVAPPPTWGEYDVETWLMQLAMSVNNDHALESARDIFDQGFDSLHATFLRNRIAGALRSSPDSLAALAATRISPNFVYDHPTLRELAAAIATLVSTKPDVDVKDPAEDIRAMLRTYATHLPRPVCSTRQQASDSIVVLLTGSTGNLGSHVLATLLAEERVKKVYTLNRSAAVGRHESVFAERGLPVELLANGKLVSLAGDVTQERLGLDAGVFDEMKGSLTHVIHNAWRVDFNLALASFERHIAGTRRLVDLCCSLPRPVKILFTSSISAAHKWDVSRGPVPEDVLTDAEVATATGYGASKFVAENLLGKAAENGLECTSLRIGQVCGSKSTGAWGTTDWVPIIVKSSIALGMLPDLEGVVSWIPMDAVASAVTDLVLSSQQLPPLVNVTHPQPVSWREVFRDISSGLDNPLPLVPFDKWLHAVEAASAKGSSPNLERIPAIKILEFLSAMSPDQPRTSSVDASIIEAGGLPLYKAQKLGAYSPTFGGLAPLSEAHAKAWINYWKKQGFLV